MGRGGVPVPKPQSRAVERLARAKAEAKTSRDVYQAIKLRDRFICRCCGTHRHVQIHHVKFRSQGGGTTLENGLLLCAICHAEIHAYRLRIEGDNANKRLRFVRTV